MAISTDISALQKSILNDVDAVMFADFGVDVLYRKVGGSADATVRAYIGANRAGRASGGQQRFGSGGNTSRAATGHGQTTIPSRMIIVRASKPGDAIGVTTGATADGAVNKLQAGDTFTVPGFAVGRPDQTSVVVRVGDGPELVNMVLWRGVLTL